MFILQWPPVTKSSSAVSEQVTCDVTQTASLASPLLPRLASCRKNLRSSVLSMANINQWPSTKHTVNKRAQHKPACLDRVSAQWNKIAFLGGFHDISCALLPLLLGTVPLLKILSIEFCKLIQFFILRYAESLPPPKLKTSCLPPLICVVSLSVRQRTACCESLLWPTVRHSLTHGNVPVRSRNFQIAANHKLKCQ